MSLAPIALFTYNRPLHTQKTVEALKNNELASQSDLFIFSDAPKNEKAVCDVMALRKYLKTIEGFKNITIIEREKNFGLANSIIDGVTNLVTKFEKIIVLEDDLVTSKYFLKYMNEALEKYANEERVMQISGYMFPVDIKFSHDSFFIPFPTSWGWATWKRAWNKFDPLMKDYEILRKNKELIKKFNVDGNYNYFKMLETQINNKIDSWAIRWYLSVFMNNGLVLYPSKTLVRNDGFDGTGIHCGNKNLFDDKIDDYFCVEEFSIPVINDEIFKEIKKNLKSKDSSMMINFMTIFKKIFFMGKNIFKTFSLLINNFKLLSFYLTGMIPWSIGYEIYKKQSILKALDYNINLTKLPKKFGYRIDERIIEYPWLFSKLNDSYEVLLDAGSILNYDFLLLNPKLNNKKIFISTLAPENNCYWKNGISYVYEDLRESCFKNDFFDKIACISTLEHVGLDNTLLYTSDISKKENICDSYLIMIKEFKRILKTNGKLFITIPYGKRKNFGWFQIFDQQMVETIINTFNCNNYSLEYYQYKNNGWVLADKKDVDDNEDFFDIHTSKKYYKDYLAFSRAIVCIELTK